ncbi:MAG TPA: glycosyl hydrolase 115 family protein [Acidobacteriaceae bacterium]|nr:glycosyl hydrolase 115 family protein [Acidobacteriaceae bacterium]
MALFPSDRNAGRLSCWLVVLILLALPARLLALGQPQYVRGTPALGGFTLAQNGRTAEIDVDSGDWWGVLHAAQDLRRDFRRVTGVTPNLVESAQTPQGDVILIGTIGKSRAIDELIREHKIDVSAIRGQWEATLTQVVEDPLPGIARALVIAGSDKRGTIYGIYDLSADIGVSPWYWWADVPVPHRDALYTEAGRWIVGPPVVKYRGIFLNDEAPALTGWVNEKYGGFNHLFYTKVFDLLLRLRANYLWPAMWNSAFAADDPLNAKLANDYGIVMGTSHEEPMMCAEKEWKPSYGPWNYMTNQKRIDAFWRGCMERDRNYEEVVTLGMRGHSDTPMSTGDNIALMEKIVADQRKILQETVSPDLDGIPQVWALYKEVQTYYEQGMRVPADVTLLWSDDNWGDLRRLPTAAERKRSGGAGIYYHFDYVGGPRSYKWLNTNYVPKIWEQMNLAWKYGATRIWVVNVGDLKPMEFPISFFLDMAWNPARFHPDNLQRYTQDWAAQQFGPEHAEEIANLLTAYTKYNGRRKPELLEPNSFSLDHFNEAQRVCDEWQTLANEAEKVGKELPPAYQDAYFELVLYPLKASAIVNELYITAGENALYAAQGRVSTNDLADQARKLLAEDAALTFEYNHVLAHGKWDHMMDQTHIGYTWWNEPPVNAMPAVTWVQPLEGPRMAVAVEGMRFAANGPFPPLRLAAFDDFNRQTRHIDIFNRGSQPFAWTARVDEPWIWLSATSGTVTEGQRIFASVEWSKAPRGRNEGNIVIQQKDGPAVTVHVTAFDPAAPTRDDLQGFVEARHYVSINAAHFTSETTGGSETDDARWVNIPDYGETLSGMTILPVTAPSAQPPTPAPTLEYRMYLFDSGKCSVQAILAPTLNFVPGRGLRYAVSFDDQPPVVVDALVDDSQQSWATAVSDGVRRVTTILNLPSSGYHTLKFRMIDPGVVLEKLVVAFASSQPPHFPGVSAPAEPAAPASYLGPPESYYRMIPSSDQEK